MPVYAKALAERERLSGQDSAKVARAAADLGLFLLEIGKAADAEAPLRRAVAIDERSADAAIDADREGLARALEALGIRDGALDLYRKTAAGNNPQLAARSFSKLADAGREHAELYYRNAVAAEEKASGKNSSGVAILLQEYALALRAGNRDPEAEPVLRRALAIQLAAAEAEPQVTIWSSQHAGEPARGPKARKVPSWR